MDINFDKFYLPINNVCISYINPNTIHDSIDFVITLVNFCPNLNFHSPLYAIKLKVYSHRNSVARSILHSIYHATYMCTIVRYLENAKENIFLYPIMQSIYFEFELYREGHTKRKKFSLPHRDG